MALSAALELQRQLADGQARNQRALEVVELERDAIALTRDVNPMAQPEGQLPLAGGRSLRWSAEPRTGEVLNTGSATVGRRFALRLFRVSVTILGVDGVPSAEVGFDRIGWRLLAQPAPYVAAPPSASPTNSSPTAGF